MGKHVTFDYSLADKFIREDEVELMMASIHAARETLESKSGAGNDFLGWIDLPEDYDINNYSGGGRLGAYKGDKIENYKIRFTGYAKDWMKDHKLADNQTFKEDEESTTVSFSSSQFDKVLELILSWGRQAEPLAPARLVKRWKEEVLAMAEKVKD